MTKRLAGLLLATLLPLAAAAQEAVVPAVPVAPAAAPLAGSTIHRHLGFFIRPELGFGYGSASFDAGGATATISGSGLNFSLALGGAVSEDFIIAGHVWNYTASNPELSAPGVQLSASGDISLVGYGLMLNWYFMPSNVYLSVSPSLTRILDETNGQSSTSDWGVGARASVGKEWWVSDHWGLGVAGSLALSSNKGGSGLPTLTTYALGVSFSATFN